MITKKFTLRLSLFLIYFSLSSFLGEKIYSQNVTISSTVPSSLTVCHTSDTFYISILNETTNELNTPNITINLPEGIEYIPGTMNESTSKSLQEFNISNLEQVIFSSSNIPAGDSLKYSIEIRASVAAVDYLLLGNVIRNQITIAYSSGSTSAQSNSYNLLYAALNIISISPVSKSLFSGETFTREITIVNAGYGSLSSFYISDIRNNTSLDLMSSNIGLLNTNKDSIFLSGNDFSSIGNNDAFFDSNESISIIQTLQGNGCQNVTTTSVIEAHWGCDLALRSTASSYAHGTITYKEPNLTVSTTSYIDPCFGANVASEQQIVFSNTG
ncbi:MAG: hypothetical protein JKY48_12770, partial [Flavobacteriales bacterium]|nr:hypothetical protein [Flavobacteriales bacterium]